MIEPILSERNLSLVFYCQINKEHQLYKFFNVNRLRQSLQTVKMLSNNKRLLFVVVTSTIYSIADNQCPSKSIFTNNKCYTMITTDADWFDAEMMCQQLFHRNGHLAAIQNSIENTAVVGIDLFRLKMANKYCN